MGILIQANEMPKFFPSRNFYFQKLSDFRWRFQKPYNNVNIRLSEINFSGQISGWGTSIEIRHGHKVSNRQFNKIQVWMHGYMLLFFKYMCMSLIYISVCVIKNIKQLNTLLNNFPVTKRNITYFISSIFLVNKGLHNCMCICKS